MIGSQEFVNVLGVPVQLTTNFIVDGGFIQDFFSTSTTVTFSLQVGATNLGPVGPETNPVRAEVDAFNTAVFGGAGGFFTGFEGGSYFATYTTDAAGNRSFSDIVVAACQRGEALLSKRRRAPRAALPYTVPVTHPLPARFPVARISAILDLFGSSPVKPLQQHMAKVLECVGELPALVEAACGGDHARVDARQERIAALENEADDLKHQLRLHLPRSLFLPVDRRDLLEVLTMQDNIANRAKDIAGLVRGRRMHFPEAIGPRLIEFTRRGVDACRQAEKTVNELDELVETGFRGAAVNMVQDMIEELDRIEKDTDVIQIDVRARLLAMEKDLPPVDVMFLYRVIDWIGDLGDLAQRVGSRLQLMLAR